MFTFFFHQSGEARKPFVKAISEILESKPRYLALPSYAYEIDVVTVTREGNIEVDERTDTELVENLIDRLAERGYEADPIEGWNNDEGHEQSETARADESTEPAGAEAPAENVNPSADDIAMTISFPRHMLSDVGIENLKKLIAAKDQLLRQAFGIETTEVQVTDEAISFPWFGQLEPYELKFAAQFICGLCKFANKSKRITSKAFHGDNPKFAMRVWAIRMGFNGAEYKDLRMFLLRNLPGDAAFRYGRPDEQCS